MKISFNDYMKIPKEQLNAIYEVEGHGTEYWVNGKAHREDGPAFEGIGIDGLKYWFINDKLHRLDGPAYENPYYEYVQYWIEGKRFSTKEEFEAVAYMYKNGLQGYL